MEKKENRVTLKRTEYKKLLQEEIGEWKRIEPKFLKEGIPWWVDLRKSKMRGKNLSWHADPHKEKIVRGHERGLIVKYAKGAGKRVLDIGCGSGWLSLELARAGLDVVGFDVSPDRIAIAKNFLRRNSYKKGFGKVRYLVGDINEIDFPANSFDAIVAWDVLHHFPYLDEVLAKCDLWLKDGGRFVTYDHIGHKLLKLAGKIQNSIVKPEGKIIPYEDLLGREMITLLQKHYRTTTLYTRLSFPIAAIFEAFFNRDFLLPILPLMVKVDKLLCNSKLFTGEYFFFYGQKNKSHHR